MNVEASLIAWLNDQLAVPVYADVPSDRPENFVTVERVGGGVWEFRDFPSLAVQCWAGTRYEASELARTLMEILPAFTDVTQVVRVEVTGAYNWPDPDSRQARYQVTATVTTKWNHP